ncbi:(2Fe-2S)-binding protein [Cloacibacillus evryensis]|uniref:(2Fe-2S)-binding protein n=1 Tax=Cloacibacillus evryensis TaxID=508460 RepID=UPI0022E0D93C|nr:(2Fe-2S)-binding protein [Cloacibacillus evryensis]MEA5035107.1 (2Fe-2S)-binding protein [Cloacibacillus evryensis]
MLINFILNKKEYTVDADPSKRLIDFLREDMGLTGTKEGCGEGECGTCTVIMDGKAVSSCLVLAGQLNRKSITTIEGLAVNSSLSVLQKSFIEHGAVQCGYCTPGMLMSATALLEEAPEPTEKEIRTALAGNICRCADYSAIVNAVADAAKTINDEKDSQQ